MPIPANNDIEFVESLGNYRPGGYHPVHLGEKLKQGRYLILNKLGFGGASTVWLSKDTQNDAAVALSILVADLPRKSAKWHLSILQKLKDGAKDHPGRQHVLTHLDDFEISGPNGTHICFTTPVMGQSISQVTRRAQGSAAKPLPPQVAIDALAGLCRGISYLHTLGIAHADLHPGNLLMNIGSGNVPASLAKIQEICGSPRTAPLQSSTQEPSPHLPQYLVEAALARDHDPSTFGGKIVISDFSDAFIESTPPQVLQRSAPTSSPSIRPLAP